MNSLSGSTSDFGLNLGLGGYVHVAQARQVLVSNERDGELGLKSRLVKAGECSAGVGRLHLGARQDALGAILSLVCGAVEARHLVIELASEVNLQLDLAVLCESVRATKVEFGDLSSFIVGNGGGGAI